MEDILPPEKAPRVRHDGWTVARQTAFCEALAKSGSVTDACEVVGKSTTSAYKARERVRGFRNRWDDAVDASRPSIESEVRRRAVEGWDEPIFQGGKQVGVRRRYSDTLLKALYQRGVETPPEMNVKNVPIDELEASLLRKLGALKRRLEREATEEKAAAGAAAAEAADRMRAAGLCP
ncbi:hypothetical protein [Sphingomonas rubra]|uniref:Terminase small subunit n=1 Tax=Sphingomonas rubra TaxID=634430 RepID=A0A1I5SR96_9SPHN|nr:hypothetical protein [Sphingomonas rubra]SFP72806.1 hypothetical protein SAMN04488241_10652 [Sphingomonas rubra]